MWEMNKDAADTNEILVLVDNILRVVDRAKARFSQDDLMDSFTEEKKPTYYDNESPHDFENDIPFYPFLGTATIIGLRVMQHTIFKDVKEGLFRCSADRIGELVSLFSVNGSSITQAVRPHKTKVFVLPESSGKWQYSCLKWMRLPARFPPPWS